MNKTIPTALTGANIASVLDLLATVPSRLENWSRPLSEGQLRQPLGSGERSFTEDLAHLIHSEARTSESIFLALLLDAPLLPEVHAVREWGRLLRFDLFPCSELLSYFRLRRLVLVRVLESLTTEQWARTVRVAGKKRLESVYWLARSLALHELDHCNDLQQKLALLTFA